MKVIALLTSATVASAMSPYKRVATADRYYGGIGPIQGFTYPQMGGRGGDQVSLGGYSASDTFLGVFDAAGSGLVSGINASTETEVGSLLGYGDFSVAKNMHVSAFISSASGFDGLFVQTINGSIVTIVTTSDMHDGQVFNVISEPSIEVSSCRSTIYVAFSARTGSYGYGWRGIMRASMPFTGGPVTLEVMADNTMTMPGFGAAFKCLSGPSVTSAGDVLFFGSQCGGNGASEMVADQFSRLTMYKTEPVLKHALTKGRQIGAGNVYPGLWRSSDGELSVVVGQNTTVPGGQSGEEFIAFSDAGVGLDGTVVFVGMGGAATYGVFKDSGAGLVEVVSNKVAVPGYPGCNFSNFPQVPSVDENGEVVFFGQCNEKIGGVFASQSGGSFGTLLTYDDKVDGQDTIYVGYGANAVSGGKAAVYMVLDDANVTNGIWVFDVPSADLLV